MSILTEISYPVQFRVLQFRVLQFIYPGKISDVLNQWGGKDVICVAPLPLPVSMGQISQQD